MHVNCVIDNIRSLEMTRSSENVNEIHGVIRFFLRVKLKGLSRRQDAKQKDVPLQQYTAGTLMSFKTTSGNNVREMGYPPTSYSPMKRKQLLYMFLRGTYRFLYLPNNDL